MVACSSKQESDLVVYNANIITVDENNSKAEAVAVKDGKIIFIGTNEDAEGYFSEKAKIIDAKGKTIIPGFIDSHAHFLGTGQALLNLDLSTAKSWEEIIRKVAEKAKSLKKGEWIIGRGWHQEKWEEIPKPNFNGYPYHTKLSEVAPENPVLLSHASGHAIIANQKAMELSGISYNSISPEGGNIVRDSAKTIVGVFEENAELLVQTSYDNYLKSLSKEKLFDLRKEQAQSAIKNALSYGITSFYDASSTFEEIDFFKKFADEGNLKIRLNVMIYEQFDVLSKYLKNYKIDNYANGFLKVNGIKMFMDGALGSRSAWMLNDYFDVQNWKGINVMPNSDAMKITELAIQNGFQVCTHAIGDRANHEILNIYSQTFVNHSEINPKELRWRVEHVQHLGKEDIPRFSKLGIIAAMQTIHCTSDAVFVETRLGKQRTKDGAYVWRSLINSGAIIVNGTDSPVEKLDTFANYYAATTRKQNNGNLFFPEQKMTRTEALKSYTIDAAYSMFREKEIGSIEKGKQADFVILSQDITSIDEELIKKTKVNYTIINGKIEFISE